jgi:multisubunit Na+/H+ antiporter MnhB subunit
MELDSTKYQTVSKRQFMRWLLLIVGVMLLASLLVIWFVSGYLDSLEELAESQPVEAAERMWLVVRVALVAIVVFAVAVGSYFVWYGHRTVRSEHFPPPGSWLVEGQTVQTGTRARRLGWAQIVLGIFVAVMACAAAYRTWTPFE